MRATNRARSPPSSAADCGVWFPGSRTLINGSGIGIHPKLRRTQLLVGGQQQGEIVDMGGIGVKVLRPGSAGKTAVDIAAQHADQADMDSTRNRQRPRFMLAARPLLLTPKRKWPAFFACWPFLFGAQEGTRSRPATPAPQVCGRPSRPCARHAGALLPDPQTQMASIFYMLAILVWCPGRDSNPHEVAR